jgi:ppGpp synthetase/RelA/SpoT-type nucleotidyltranferase
MITSAQILNKYRSVEPYLEIVRKQVRDSLLVLCEEEGYALVAARIKTLESVSEKVETGRFERWSKIDDLVAATVVVPTLAHERQVIDFLRESFDQFEIRPRGSTLKAPEVFRFDCTRFIGRLRSPDEDARSPIHGVSFEVQIKSAFEHAWSVTTHALTYKSSDVNWSKLRLTAQLKAAVEQLDTLVLSFDNATKYIEPSVWPEIAAKAELKEFFSDRVAEGRIPVELTPKDWSRFTDNVFGLVASRGDRPKPGVIVALIRKDFDAELAAMGPNAVPLSISLWQLTFASLFKAGSITTSLKGHWPLVTPELEDLYPSLRGFNPRFDYS